MVVQGLKYMGLKMAELYGDGSGAAAKTKDDAIVNNVGKHTIFVNLFFIFLLVCLYGVYQLLRGWRNWWY